MMRPNAPAVLRLRLASMLLAAPAAADPGWLVRYEVRFAHGEDGVPEAAVEGLLEWTAPAEPAPAWVALEMPDDGFPGGYGSHLRGFEAQVPPGSPEPHAYEAYPLAPEHGRHLLAVLADGRAGFRYTVRLEHDASEWGPGPDEAPYAFEGGAFWTGRALFACPREARAELVLHAPEDGRVSAAFEPLAPPGRSAYAVDDPGALWHSFLMVGRHEEARFEHGDSEVIVA